MTTFFPPDPDCSWLLPPHVPKTPEVALACAVLHRCILDCVTPGASKEDRRSAEWFLDADNEEDDHPMSFVSIAGILEMDAHSLRAAVVRFVTACREQKISPQRLRYLRG